MVNMLEVDGLRELSRSSFWWHGYAGLRRMGREGAEEIPEFVNGILSVPKYNGVVLSKRTKVSKTYKYI